MKPIHPYLNVPPLRQTTKAPQDSATVTPTVKSVPPSSTCVSLSSVSQQIGQHDATNGVNMEKVTQFKQQIEQGNYQISPERLATKLQGEL